MKVSLKSITPDAEINIVEIARVSSGRQDKSENPTGLINYLIKNKHFSPFQHSYMTVEIVTSKAIGIQLLRHLSFTFQEFSQRYSVVENIEPIEIRKQAVKNRQSSEEVFDPLVEDTFGLFESEPTPAGEMVEHVLDIVQNLYKELLNAGVAKECARMILPMATQTTLYMTGSVRSWIHFIQIRDDVHAQKEAQIIAREIKDIFIDQLPIISSALDFKKQNYQPV